jgi:nicotinamidase-related amidase
MMALDAKVALLVVDMQKGMASPTLAPRNNPAAEQNMLALLAHWRDAGRPIVHIRHMSRTPGSVFWPGQSGCEFQDAFVPQDGEHVVEKNVPDAFANSGLERWLHARAISRLVVVGVSTNNSVESTARSGGNLGFKVIVASDATFTFDQVDLNGRLWTAQDVHDLSLSNLTADYAAVFATAEVIASN